MHAGPSASRRADLFERRRPLIHTKSERNFYREHHFGPQQHGPKGRARVSAARFLALSATFTALSASTISAASAASSGASTRAPRPSPARRAGGLVPTGRTVTSPAEPFGVAALPPKRPPLTGARATTTRAVMTLAATTRAVTTRAAAPAQARHYLGQFTVTCYDNYGHTRSGAMAGPNSVAVDPNVIPLGARIYIDGVGPRTADDTGSAIIGDHVDIWEPSYNQCINWGVRVRGVYRLAV